MRVSRLQVGMILMLALLAGIAPAQVTITENFTGPTTANTWYFFYGACLTAGSSTTSSLTSPGSIPTCATLAQPNNYYNESNSAINTSNPFEPLLGGISGTLIGGTSGSLIVTPDPVTAGGALRLTNAPTKGTYPSGMNERGAIISATPFSLSQGLQLTFTTETYDPSSCITPSYNQCPGGPVAGTDGADGISFFLQDALQTPDIGGLGGSLAYSCSNRDPDGTQRSGGTYTRGYDGIIGGYIGVGIDEGGEFMNGAVIKNPTTGALTAWDGTQLISGHAQTPSAAPWGIATYASYGYTGAGPNGFDNTSTGYGWKPGVVGIRGAGSTAFSYLHSTYPTQYPSSLTDAQRTAAVQQACISGLVWDYSHVTTSSTASSSGPTGYNGNASQIPGSPVQWVMNPYSAYQVLPVSPATPLLNYPALTYSTLPGGAQISNLSGNYRGVITPVTNPNYGVPITYNLTITPAGLLTVSYSYNGGAYQSVISGYNITTGNGPLPANVRFGFAGSMGGAQNTHEIMCFKATPAPAAASSGGVNQKQSSQVETGSQLYLAKYNSQTWAGYLTSQSLLSNTSNIVTIGPVNWDASCVLTGGTCTATGTTGVSAQGSVSRNILTWSGSAGIPFEWTNLSTAEQAALNTGDSGDNATSQLYRLNYLRGDRTNEQTSTGSNAYAPYPGYRTRTSVLGDIIDSGATWVGPPSAGYPATWKDTLYPSSAPAENAGQSYTAFTTQEQTRTNVVYAGANDGLLHGFRTGAYTSAGVFDTTATNDGKELLAYMPGYVELNIQTPLPENDYSAPQYGHHYDVDAPPGTGDLFYGGTWHTWLVGGLGPGGSAIYALDITDSNNFAAGSVTEASAASVVVGEWSSSPSAATATFTCTHVANSSTTAALCGNNLGNTYGTPQIKRFHNGSWGVIFGNGYGSSTGDAGVFVMLVDPSSGAKTIYFLGTGNETGDGIANATGADLDGDHVVDYIYAGDLLGNVWRFDVTSSDPTVWAVQGGATPTPTFTTGSGQPITSKLIVALVPSTPSVRVLVEFGTGQVTQFTNVAGPLFSQTQQYLYGVWDYNLATWNTLGSTQFGVLPISGFTAPSALSGTGSLQQQTFTSASSLTDYRTVSSTAICWADTSACSSNRQYGWYLALTTGYSNASDVNLPTATASTTAPSAPVYEQVIYNPLLVDGAFIVNTTIPATSSVASCVNTVAGGWTMAINPATGGAFTKAFFNSTTTNTSQVTNGLALSGTGTPSIVNSGSNVFLVTQTVSGTGAVAQIYPPAGTSGNRLTWIQKR